EFIRGWDDGRGIDAGRNVLSAQSDAIQNIVGSFGRTQLFKDTAYSGPFRQGDWILSEGLTPSEGSVGYGANNWLFDASRAVRTATETRPHNVAFNYIVRAK
ncbi:phage tail protein, partial [Salmonella enterica]|nr:phage tail protein [Salmonella enterica]